MDSPWTLHEIGIQTWSWGQAGPVVPASRCMAVLILEDFSNLSQMLGGVHRIFHIC